MSQSSKEYHVKKSADGFLSLDGVDDYGMCTVCGFRAKVSCVCGMTFAEKAKTVRLDMEALRILHGR